MNQFHAKAHKADECGQSAKVAPAAGAPVMSEIVITDKMMAGGNSTPIVALRTTGKW
jgi:hypothetical protein